METVRGIASHCQQTSRVNGAGNSPVTTTYIALFRLGARQVQFSSGSPLSISDGDQVIVAGQPWRGALYADAVRNVTTGLTRQSGIGSRVFAAVLLPAVGALIAWLASAALGRYAGLILAGFVAGSIYSLVRAFQTGRAWAYIHSEIHTKPL